MNTILNRRLHTFTFSFYIFFARILICSSFSSSIDGNNDNMATRALSLRQRLLQGGKTYGPLVLSDSPVVAELLAGIPGYGHILLDMEHSPTNTQSCQSLLQAFDAGARYFRTENMSPPEALVRLDSPHDPVQMKKILDSMRLPGGVLVPMVEDAETAQQVVRSTRYPRQNDSIDDIDGIRGCAVPFVRASGWGSSATNDEYLRQCREDLLVMVQVESPQAVEAIPEIAAVEGVDLIFIGPFDLSASAGRLGQFDNPDVQALLKRAEEAVLASPCLLGGFRTPGVALRDMFQKGYSLVCGAVDLGLLREAARLDAKAGQEGIEQSGKS